MELLKWADNNPERMARIMDDAAYQDFSVDLSSDELSFVTLTAWLSRVENGKHVESHYTGQAEEEPSYNQYLPLKTDTAAHGAICTTNFPIILQTSRR